MSPYVSEREPIPLFPDQLSPDLQARFHALMQNLHVLELNSTSLNWARFSFDKLEEPRLNTSKSPPCLAQRLFR